MAEPSLQLGNGNWAGKSGNLLAYHKANNNFYADELTFARASTGTIVNADGLIEQVPYNKLTYSEQFDNAAWTKFNSSISANATTSPDGTTNADKLIASATNNTHGFYAEIVSPSAGTYTQSAFFKAGEYNFACVRLATDNDTKRYAVVLNLTTGLITATDSSGSPTNTSSKVDSLGNGWYRLSVISQHTSGNAYPTFALSSTAVPTFSSSLPEFTGNGTSGIYIYGAQLNLGSTAKTYYPTTTRLNVPRVDYLNNSNGSLLLESQRTNLNTYSDPTDAQKGSLSYASVTYQDSYSWGLGNLINNAIAFGDNSTTRYAYYNSSVASGTTYSLSFFIKMDDNSVPVPTTDFLVVLAGTSFGAGYNVESYGNNVHRVSVSGVASASNTANGVLKVASNSTKGFRISAFQVEAGSYSTSYIPTSGTTVTRNQDTCATTGLSNVIGQTEGTLFAEGNAIPTGASGGIGNSGYLFAISDNTLNNQISIRLYPPDGKYYIQVRIGGAFVAGVVYTPTSVGQNVKIAIGYKANDFAFYVNGIQVGTASSGAVPALSTVNAGAFGGNLDCIVNTNQAQLYKTRLTNAELATLTTI